MRLPILLVLASLATSCAGGGETVSLADPPGVQLAAAGSGLADGLALQPRLQPELRDDRLIARDGTALPLRRWLPASRPIAVVLALHGFNDYSNAFADPGAALASQGIATYAYDQRGFGRAAGRGRWAGARRLAADAATAAALLRARYPGVPLYLMGESMGGAVAIVAATGSDGVARAPVDGIILAAPAVWGRKTMNLVERLGLWFADFIPSAQLSPNALPVTIHPSDNLPMLRKLGADPLVIKTTRADTLNGLVDLMDAALAAGRRLDRPALILYGANDEIVPLGPMVRFVEELPASMRAHQRVALYPEGYHMLMRDLEGALVTRDVAAWIRDPAAPLPSGADQRGRSRLTGDTEPPEPALGHIEPATRSPSATATTKAPGKDRSLGIF